MVFTKKQRAAALRNLKKARRARGGRRKGRKKMAKRSRALATRASHTIGASYRAASTGIIVASPAIAAAHSGARSPEAFVGAYRSDLKPFALGLGVHVADTVIGQRVFNHNSALGRGSVTAWAAEAIPTIKAAQEGAQGGLGWGTATYTHIKTGYSPRAGFAFRPESMLYLGVKYGGGLARKLSTTGLLRSVAKPVKKMLGSMGASL